MVTTVSASPSAATSNLNVPLSSEAKRNEKNTNATTGASAAGVRALTARFVAFYFRAPAKAFFRTRVEQLFGMATYYELRTSKAKGANPSSKAFARAVNPRVRAKEAWSWRTSSFGLLEHAVRTYGWSFLPYQVLPPLLANAAAGAVLYTSYLQTLSYLHGQASERVKRVFPPPTFCSTFTAGAIAGSVNAVIAAPLDALQVRFKTREVLNGQYKSMWRYGRLKLKELGFRSIYAGFGLSLTKDALGFGIFFATFEYIKAQSFYSFVTRYYGGPQVNLDSGYRYGPAGRDGVPTIRPHYALEPAFLMLAGVSASVVQQSVQCPLARLQDIYYSRLDCLDRLLKADAPGSELMRKYAHAYKKSFQLCSVEAIQRGGWGRWAYRGFIMNTIKQIPSTSAGLVIFELVRRRYADESEAIQIEKDGYDILLT